MIFSAFAILVVLLSGYVWMLRGFFSALLHLVCTVAAGAIAFGFWEVLANLLLDQGGALENSAWGIGLALPFALSLIPIRIVFDKLIPANVKLIPPTDYAGGFVCGSLAGVITAGIVTTSVGFLRVDSEFLGYRAVEYNGTGNIVRTGGMLLPVDRLVTRVYGFTSMHSFSTDTPLAMLHPNLEEVGSAQRMTFGNGKNRNTMKPGDAQLLGRYTVGEGKDLDPNLLLRDKWNNGAQNVKDTDDQPLVKGTYLDGYVVKFGAGAKDRGDGKVVVGAGQVRLVIAASDDSYFTTVYPIAAVCQADAATAQDARFRFDGQDVFLASAGGAAESVFGFEFPVPNGYLPVALYVKNVRFMLRDQDNAVLAPKLGTYGNTAARDSAIASKRYAGGGSAGVKDAAPLDTSKEGKAGDGRPLQQNNLPTIQGFQASNRMRPTLQKGTTGADLTIDESNVIIDGRTKIAKEVVSKASTEKSLRIEKFGNSSDTVIVQLEVGPGTPFSLLGPVSSTLDAAMAPCLRDSNDTLYYPVGWIYNDDILYDVRFTPGQPVMSIEELGKEGVRPTRSRQDQKLILLYQVSKGVTLTRFTIGDKNGHTSICAFDPPIPLLLEQK
jgi:uncharacterized membrane protein required for colicin V production